MVDILAFSKIFGHKIEQGDLALARKVDYDIVFIIEPLPQEYYRQTETRRETYQQSLEIHQKIVACYQQYCFDMGKNPEQFIVYVQAPTKINMSEEEIRQSISQRAEFILKTVFSTSR